MGLTSVIVPPFAWLTSLAFSYVTQDFTCSIYDSAGRSVPDGRLLTVLLVGNILLLLLVVLCGVAGWRQWRKGRPVVHFLGLVGVGTSVLFGLGIVMIAVPPLFLEVCP